MSTVHDRRYARLIKHLVACRRAAGVTQEHLAAKLRIEQSAVSKVENLERRIGVIELRDWLTAIAYDPATFLREIGWLD